MDSSLDVKSAFKLAQLTTFYMCESKTIEKILEQVGDVNLAFPDGSLRRFCKEYLFGYTALHCACEWNSLNMLISLLKHGADITKKNKDGNTALHLLIPKQKSIDQPLHSPFIDAVLSAHVDSNNISNPCDEEGLSHFHIACMSSNLAAVHFFLDNGVSLDEPVSTESKFCPGYTPLHFTAMCTNAQVAEILIAHGANMHIADAKEMTPLHLLVERRIQMYDSLLDANRNYSEDSRAALHAKIQDNEKIINMLMENMSIDNDCSDSIGLSNFHVACLLQDTSAAQHLIDQVRDLDECVNMDSQLWPGYTAMHFAAHISIFTVEMLIKKGASVVAKNAEGLTPLDICVERYKIEDVSRVMSLNAEYENVLFSDGKTKLSSFISAIADLDQLENYRTLFASINNTRISMESSLWPGLTPLHLLVLFAEKSKKSFRKDAAAATKTKDHQLIEYFLNEGADLGIQDSHGRTALHLAFRLGKMTLVDLMFGHHHQIPNVLDEDHLSHLHIACATTCKGTLKKFPASDNLQVNATYKGTSPIRCVRPGSTPLHVCLANREFKDELKDNVRILLNFGANPRVKDAYGLTPIHWLLERHSVREYDHGIRQLVTKLSIDCVAEEHGISHLHVLAQLDNQSAVKRLIKNGANVNATIAYTKRNDQDPLAFLSRYDKCTPLHLIASTTSSMLKLLLKHGADVFAERADGTTALNGQQVLHHFLSKVEGSIDLRKRMRREFGWTRLHLACYSLRADGFEDIVKAELTDIHARVRSNSPVWRGCTPLHLLVLRLRGCDEKENFNSMLQILLDHGADVTLVNEEGNSPLVVLLDDCYMGKHMHKAALLLKYHRDFRVNPVDSQGVSHFHIACYWNDVDAVKGFLLHGVDVNRPVGYFSKWRPGCTPLHLASKFQVVDLLINHGANVHTEDVQGRTVLAEAVSCRRPFDENVVTRIIESGADINGFNFQGETAFQRALSGIPLIEMDILMFYIKQGFAVNSCNPFTGLGYIAIVLASVHGDVSAQMRIAEVIMNVKSTNTLGRTTVHHIVAGTKSNIGPKDFESLFGKLIETGCDIDEQDNEGKTALHLAVEFVKAKAVVGLLASGADINILDKTGKSALCYALLPTFTCHPFAYDAKGEDYFFIIDVLHAYAFDLKFLKLDLCKINADIIAHESILDFANSCTFLVQVAASNGLKVGVRSLRLYDFLSETRAVVMYRSLNETERCKIDEYFDLINDVVSVKEIRGILKLQHRKAVKRMELFSLSTDSFRSLLGFDLPYLCVESIFQFLSNLDLKNIIIAEIKG